MSGLRSEADVVFPRERVAVFVDGCFWHSCPDHGVLPKSNREWWEHKLLATVDRDRDADRRLAEGGWTVVRVWEHEPVAAAVDRIEAVVHGRRLGALQHPSDEPAAHSKCRYRG